MFGLDISSLIDKARGKEVSVDLNTDLNAPILKLPSINKAKKDLERKIRHEANQKIRYTIPAKRQRDQTTTGHQNRKIRHHNHYLPAPQSSEVALAPVIGATGRLVGKAVSKLKPSSSGATGFGLGFGTGAWFSSTTGKIVTGGVILVTVAYILSRAKN